jgi:hypothetical protein
MTSIPKFNRIVVKTDNYLKNQEVYWLNDKNELTNEKYYSIKYHVGDIYYNSESKVQSFSLEQAKILFSIIEIIENGILIKIDMIKEILINVDRNNSEKIKLYLLLRLAVNNNYLIYLKNETINQLDRQVAEMLLVDFSEINIIDISIAQINKNMCMIKTYLLDYCGIRIKTI